MIMNHKFLPLQLRLAGVRRLRGRVVVVALQHRQIVENAHVQADGAFWFSPRYAEEFQLVRVQDQRQ